jgi:crotonobetainyl-CoA:carnitine CoA-transferase CaiB-like acyl-CoA transferase
VLNLKTEAGREVFGSLAERVDVIAENFRDGVTDRLGIVSDVLRARNPRLIYASITGFGGGGPLGDQLAIDGAVQAMAGALELSERNGLGSWPVAIPVADLAGAAAATQAVLAALYARETTGRGCHIDVSLFEALLPWVAINRQASVAPPITQVVVGNDGLRFLVQAPMHFHRRLLQLVREVPGCRDAADDPRMADSDGARAHPAEFTQLVKAAFATASRAVWLERLAAAGIPAAPVLHVAEALNHPQLKYRDAVTEVVNLDGTSERVVLSPYRFDGHRLPEEELPPSLGRDTRQVLATVLGYGDEAVDDLAARGAFSDLEE